MKTWKITEILKARKWEWKFGDVFYIPLKLDNWEQITLGKKKEDAFKIGDVVNYEDYTDDKGNTKQREVKENPFPKRSFNSEWNNKGAMIGMAIKVAFDKVYSSEDDFQKAAALSQRIYDLAMQMMWEEKEETKSESKSESDDYDLPF